ncbi:MAG: ABC transporter permease, partial [Woeseiaceae bacterium]|nr:ABC transporter permease [Woeseiaceae bacterium]
MIRPTELFIGLRYLRARRKTRFVSFITGISLAGIALGVAALIVILSVMNGFEGELRDRLLSMTAHGYVAGPERRLSDWREIREQLANVDGIVAASPFVEMEGMVRSGSDLRPLFVTGIDPAYERDVAGRTINFVAGDLDVLAADARGIVLGRLLALDLGVRVGDGVTLLVPRTNERGELEPLFERFVVRGVFEAGVQDHDSALALVHIGDAARIQRLDDQVTGVRFLADDVMAAPQISAGLRDTLGSA